MSKKIRKAPSLSLLSCVAALAIAPSAFSDQEDVSKLIKKACGLMEQQKAKAAEEVLHEAVRIAPDNAEAHVQLGAALAQQDNYDTAILEEKQALKLDSKSLGARIILGHIYANLKKNDDAITMLKEACDLKPQNYRPRRDLGIAYLAAGNTDEAINSFKKAVELKPEAADSHRRLGALLAERGNVRDGLNEVGEALRLAPGDPENHVAMGNALLIAGEEAAAIPPFKQALKIQKDHPYALSGLGWAMASKDQSKLQEGINDQRVALKIYPEFLPAYVRLADLLSRQGKTKEAESEYKAALKISPDDAIVRTAYAKFLSEKVGRKDDARTELKKVLEKSPHFKPASDALAGLDQSSKTK